MSVKNAAYLHHLNRLINRPHHDLLPCCLALLPEARTIECCKRLECHREGLAVFPEPPARDGDTAANMCAPAVGQPPLCRCKESRMPKTKKDTRRKCCLPCRLRSDDFVHELEEPLWVILHFHIDIELDMLVLGLQNPAAVSLTLQRYVGWSGYSPA